MFSMSLGFTHILILSVSVLSSSGSSRINQPVPENEVALPCIPLMFPGEIVQEAVLLA